jgi:hypothetical protein
VEQNPAGWRQGTIDFVEAHWIGERMNAKTILRGIKITMILMLLITACSPLAVVQPTATTQALGSINGWVWHDQCVIFEGEGGSPDNLNPGCIEDAGGVHADGVKTANELPIGGVKISLGLGACPSTGLAETTTVATDLSYSFTGLSAGTYCVSIDPLQEQNKAPLLPGNWTYPSLTYDGPASTTIMLKAGENKFDVNFGWDYQFLPEAVQPTSSPAP